MVINKKYISMCIDRTLKKYGIEDKHSLNKYHINNSYIVKSKVMTIIKRDLPNHIIDTISMFGFVNMKENINFKTLSMENLNNCILGQLYGSFGRGRLSVSNSVWENMEYALDGFSHSNFNGYVDGKYIYNLNMNFYYPFLRDVWEKVLHGQYSYKDDELTILA